MKNKRCMRILIGLSMIMLVVCAGKKVSLQLRLPEGMSRTSRVTTEQHIVQTLQGQTMDIQQNIIMEYVYDVLNVTEAGDATIKLTYSKIGFSQDGPMGKIEYRSWEEGEEIPLMAQGFASLVDQSVTMTLTPEGRVTDVTGFDALLENIMKDFDIPVDEETRAQFEDNLRTQFGDVTFKETMEKMFAVYPDKPVGVGDIWSAEYMFTAGLPMVVNNTWQVKSIVADRVVIEVNSKIRPNKEGTLPQFGGVNLTYDIQGTQQGQIVIDTLAGWLWEGEMKQNLSGTMSMAGGVFGSDEGMKWPIEMESVVQIETIE